MGQEASGVVKALPVAGYKDQPTSVIELVNDFKRDEERLLRKLEALPVGEVNIRWLALGRTHLEQAFMAINRAIFQPGRVTLPEDIA